MRIGFNPHKDQKSIPNDYFHQVIIPVYIPNQEVYFKESLEILKLCLNSLFLTSHSKTYFSVINNGSCNEVKNYLEQLFQEKKIHEIIHTSSIGKLNAILKGIVGHNFPLITITDSDVLFLNQWQTQTYTVFEEFPKAGAVSTTPNSKMVKHFTSSVFLDTFFSRKIQFSQVENPKAMQSFAESIGNHNFFNEINLKKYLTVSSSNGIKAVVGAGHFVATYKGELFSTLQHKHSEYNLGGNSEIAILDKPVLENGFWRLSTTNNYTYHLGNTIENWMEAEMNSIVNEATIEIKSPKLSSEKSNRFMLWVKIHFFGKILFKKSVWKLFLHYKGLNKQEAEKY